MTVADPNADFSKSVDAFGHGLNGVLQEIAPDPDNAVYGLEGGIHRAGSDRGLFVGGAVRSDEADRSGRHAH